MAAVVMHTSPSWATQSSRRAACAAGGNRAQGVVTTRTSGARCLCPPRGGVTLDRAGSRVMTRADPPGAPSSSSNGTSGAPAKSEDVPFGYKNKDPWILGAGLLGLGFAMYYGLQAAGLEPGIAGNWVQAILFLGMCVGWVSTYLYRVATKQMTYAKQLDNYEAAVMQKRLEEMTEAELEALMAEVEEDKARRAARLAARQQQQQDGSAP